MDSLSLIGIKHYSLCLSCLENQGCVKKKIIVKLKHQIDKTITKIRTVYLLWYVNLIFKRWTIEINK